MKPQVFPLRLVRAIAKMPGELAVRYVPKYGVPMVAFRMFPQESRARCKP